MTRTRLAMAVSSAIAFSLLSGCSTNRTIPEASKLSRVNYNYQQKNVTFRKAIYRNQHTQVKTQVRRFRPVPARQVTRQRPQQARPGVSGTRARVANYRKKPGHNIRKASYRRPAPAALNTTKQYTANQHSPDVWQDIYRGFRFRNYSYQPRVRNQINRFARNPWQLQTMSQRATKHLPNIVAEVKRRGMPTEIALLPFVESAFKTSAYSHAKAAGLWQFIPSTGRRYGLKQSRSYDGRYDSFAATNAALSYLQDLNKRFHGDWLLSLAAYNCGEARVEREIARNRARGLPTDFWHLSLPRETRQYVPRLLAYKEIYSKPYAYGIKLPRTSTHTGLVQVRVNKRVDLRHVARRAGLPAYTLTSINRSYKKGVTTPQYSNSIALPREHAGKILRVLHASPVAAGGIQYASQRRYNIAPAPSRSYNKRATSGQRHVTHRVRSGENLYRIALKYGTSVGKIMRMNGLRSHHIQTGSHLKVATSSKRYSYS